MSRASAAWSSCGTPRQERVLLGQDAVAEARRCEDPADAEGGRQGLADRSQRHHAVGRQALQRAHGLPVVAELGVVVVLEDHPVDVVRPLHQLVATGRAQHRPGRALVGRRQQHGAGTAGAQLVDPDPLRVDRRRPTPAGRLAARCGRGPAGPGSSSPIRSMPCAGEGAEHERQPLPEAAHDDRVRGVGAAGTHPPVVAGEHRAQAGRRPRRCRRRGRRSAGAVHGIAQRPQPVARRERTQVGDAVAEVDSRTGAGSAGRPRPHRTAMGSAAPVIAVGDPGARPDGGDDVPLGEQLLVRRDHQAPGHAQLVRQLSGRGQPLAGAQPAGPDRGPQRLLDLLPQRARRRTVPRRARAPAPPRRSRRSCGDPSAPIAEWTTRTALEWTFALDRSGARLKDTETRPTEEAEDMSIGITLALLAAIGYGTADFVGGAGRPAGTHHVHRLHRPGRPAPRRCWSSRSPRPARRRRPTLAWALLAGLGSAAGSIFLLRGLSRGRMAVVAPTSAVGAAVLPVLAGLASGERPVTLVWIGLVLAFPGIWLVSRQVPDGTGTSPEPSSAGRGAFVDGLLGGLGFGVLFVALGQIPESAGTLPLALNQLTGALVTVAIATVLRQTWQPSRAAAGLGRHVGTARGVRQPRVRRGQPPRRPRRGRRARLALPRRHGAPGPRPCSASASAPGSASAWSSAPRPSGLIAAG